MTNQQLYLAMGLPTFLYLLGFTTTILVIVWQAKGIEKVVHLRVDALDGRIDSLAQLMDAKFLVVDAKFDVVDAKLEALRQGMLRIEQVLDARLGHLEEERNRN